MIAPTVDEYLGQVRRSLAGVDRPVRDDILRELGGNLAESVRANGGNVSVAIGAMGPAREVARRYRDVYGYGWFYKLIFVAGSAALGLGSLPVLAPGPEFGVAVWVPALVLSALVALLLWVSVAAGSRVGLIAGGVAAASRIAGFLILNVPYQYFDRAGVTLLVVVSVLLVLLGWLPGRAKKVWERPEAAL